MKKQNLIIRIVSCPELIRMRIGELAGKSGMIVEDLTLPDRRTKGYMVLLEEVYGNEFLWFIPKEAICYE